LSMPVMDGYAFLKHVRQDEQLRSLKVIVSSASVSLSDQQKSLDAGADSFLPKPVKAEELFRLLAQHLTLNWIYPENQVQMEAATTIDTNTLVLPPDTALQQLLDLAQRGRLQQLTVLAEQIAQQDDRYQLFMQQVLDLAKQYHIEQLEQFLQIHLVSRNEIQE
jgi:DNA-binding response OmpR family regulator